MSFFNPIFNAMGTVLSWLYAIVPNYGVAIILLTVLVRVVLYPLTAKQARSMIAMQRVQPEIKKLQAKYKDDKQKLNEEMMKFYKENKINPFGGCLPLLAQMPVFISLFRVLHDPQKYVPKGSAFYSTMCGSAVACKKPSMDFFGMNLATSAGSNHGSFAASLPYWILVALVVVTAYLQQQQTMKNSPGGGNPQAQIIGKVMPLVFAFISINLPAGVVLYFFVSNLWQMGQQQLIIRKLDAAPVGGGTKGGVVEAKSSEASSSGGGLLARLTRPAADAAAADPKAEPDGRPAADAGGNGAGKSAPKPANKTTGKTGGKTNGGKSATKGGSAGTGSPGARAGTGSTEGGGNGQASRPARRRSNKKRRR